MSSGVVRVEPAEWSRVVAHLSRSAPSRQQGYYRRLGNLRRLMAPDGWLSQPAERIRRAMGTSVSLRTAEDTLRFAVEHRLLVREKRGQKHQQAVYQAVVPIEAVQSKTVPVVRFDAETGLALPNGRVHRLSPHRNLGNRSSGGRS